MGSPFKMTPKQEGFIKAMKKAGKTEAANKIEAGIKKNEGVDGAMLMNKDYALKMGGYEGRGSSSDPGKKVVNWFKQKRAKRAEQQEAAKNAAVKLDDKTKGKDPRYKYNEAGEQVAVIDPTSKGAYQIGAESKKAATEGKGMFDPEAGRNKPFVGGFIDREGKPTDDPANAKGFRDEKGKYQQFSFSRSEREKQIKDLQRAKKLHDADRARMQGLKETWSEYEGKVRPAKTTGKSPAKMYGKKKK